jgi:hypothetical protein
VIPSDDEIISIENKCLAEHMVLCQRVAEECAAEKGVEMGLRDFLAAAIPRLESHLQGQCNTEFRWVVENAPWLGGQPRGYVRRAQRHSPPKRGAVDRVTLGDAFLSFASSLK